MSRFQISGKTLLFASSALVAAGVAMPASAQSTIDNAGVISVTAGLEGFIAATSQRGTGADLSSEVTAADQIINQADGTEISTPQTIFGNDMTAETRLNQSTTDVAGEVPDTTTTFTGATSVGADGAISIDAGLGVVSQQDVTGGGGAGNVFSSAVGADGAPATNTATVSAPTVSGNVTVSGNQTVADTLVNDAQNTVNVTGAGDGALAAPGAIANSQSVTPESDQDITVSSASYGDAIIDVTGGDTSVSGDLRLDENAIGARAATNTAVNELVAGTADSPLEGGFAATPADRLTAGDIASGAIAEFDADLGIANLQSIGIADTGETETTATTEGTLNIGLSNAATAGTENVSSSLISARGNSILSEASGNVATNRALATTNGIEGVSVGVASLQEQTGVDSTGNVAATTTGLIVVDDGTLAATAVQAGELDGVTVDLSGNRIGAEATSNEALNVAAVTSTGSLGGAESYVAGSQAATDVTVDATVLDAAVVGAFDTANAGSSAALNNNEVFAMSALNTQTNVLQNTGSSGFGASTMVGTSKQSISGGSSDALVTASLMELVTGDTSNEGTATASLTNNSVLASATGNVSSTSISNRSARFSFSR